MTMPNVPTRNECQGMTGMTLSWPGEKSSQHENTTLPDAKVQFDEDGRPGPTPSPRAHEQNMTGATGGFPELGRPRTRTLGKLKMRGQYDHDPTDWWFASTAIPLVAATFAPMANLLSIAALVVPWRNNITHFDVPLLKYADPAPINDPTWCYDLNALSLACGVIGNLFLLFNFTQRVRYIIALPVTIFFFYLASGILIGIVVSMYKYTPPLETQVYSQGFWHAVIAACLYLLNSMILMVNMTGYFLGHYPQHFTLTDEQRNLILQTMLFFIWLGGGAGVFARIQEWSYPDALYFCDVTILTIGFGDFFATTDSGRGLVFPFSVGGTIILGLMVNSIHKFARELSKEKVVRKHVEHRRVNTLSRAVALDELDDKDLGLLAEGKMPNISSPSQKNKGHEQQPLNGLAQQEREKRQVTNLYDEAKDNSATLTSPLDAAAENKDASSPHASFRKLRKGHGLLRAMTIPITVPISMTTYGLRKVTTKNTKKILMIEERDRFNAMRRVQRQASQFNRYYALAMSIISFGMLWCLGAMVFYFAEAETQQLNYFQGLYFCYVSLLTIGYGDLSPRSNAGKSFFVVWSLIAVPTMTILVSDLGDTVIGGFKRGVLQNDLGLTSSSSSQGRTAKFFRRVLHTTERLPGLRRANAKTAPSNVENGPTAVDVSKDSPDDNELVALPNTIDDLVEENLTEPEMLKKLAFAIRKTAEDLRKEPGKKYKYEEWVEFTRLIRFSKAYASGGPDSLDQLEYDEANDGVVDWDWLDDRSPMTSDQSESEWVLDRLCESLLRIFKRGDLSPSMLVQVQSQAASYLRSPGQVQSTGVDISTPDNQQANIVMSEPQEDTASMGMMKRLLQGDAGNGALKWSRRARARRDIVQHESDRRRSSTSARHRRAGPFAALHRGHRNTSLDQRRQDVPEANNKGLGIT